jgi:hypothetical protein
MAGNYAKTFNTSSHQRTVNQSHNKLGAVVHTWECSGLGFFGFKKTKTKTRAKQKNPQ